jgi:hypothetical protein
MSAVHQILTEIPQGAINGTNLIFTLAAVPPSLVLFKDGIVQTPGQDYSILGTIITFIVGNAPDTGSNLFAIVGVL